MYIHIGQIWIQSSIAIPKVNPIQHCLPLLEMKIYASRMFRRYLSVIPGNVPWNIHIHVGNIRIISSRSTKILIGVKDRAIKTRHCPFERSMRRAIRETVQAEQKFRDVWGEQSLTLEFHYFAVASSTFSKTKRRCLLAFYSILFDDLTKSFERSWRKCLKQLEWNKKIKIYTHIHFLIMNGKLVFNIS